MEDKEIERMCEFEENYWWFIGRKQIIISTLQNQLKDKTNLKILDVGCGTGGTTSSLTKFGTTYGTDFSTKALQFSNKRGLNVLKSGVYELPFISETFDIITIFDTLEHIKDDLLVLKELKRILKNDGLIFLTVPAYQFLWSDHDVSLSHYRRYNAKKLSIVVERAGLKKVRISYMITILFPALAIFRLVSKLKKSNPNPTPSLIRVPKYVNKFLKKVLSLENKILQKINLPFGLSLICIVKKFD